MKTRERYFRGFSLHRILVRNLASLDILISFEHAKTPCWLLADISTSYSMSRAFDIGDKIVCSAQGSLRSADVLLFLRVSSLFVVGLKIYKKSPIIASTSHTVFLQKRLPDGFMAHSWTCHQRICRGLGGKYGHKIGHTSGVILNIVLS